jgi:uncharacterized protein YegP (UPF0339 family)
MTASRDVPRYSFEIEKRAKKRFSWVFVEYAGRGRRVLARSNRDYKRKKRAEKAVCTFRKKTGSADIRDADGGTDAFDLPPSRFEFTPYAVSLRVSGPSAQRTCVGADDFGNGKDADRSSPSA